MVFSNKRIMLFIIEIFYFVSNTLTFSSSTINFSRYVTNYGEIYLLSTSTIISRKNDDSTNKRPFGSTQSIASTILNSMNCLFPTDTEAISLVSILTSTS